jgi:twitching motility protein PilT
MTLQPNQFPQRPLGQPAPSSGQQRPLAAGPGQQQPQRAPQQRVQLGQPVSVTPVSVTPVSVTPVSVTVTPQGAASAAPAQPAAPAQSVTGGIRPGMANPNDPNLKPLEKLFALMAQYDSSDLHLKANCPIIMRVKGDMRPLAGAPITSEQIYEWLKDITTPEQLAHYDKTGDLDFSHMLPDQARSRFRLNVFRDKKTNALVARRISTRIPSFEELNLPGNSLTRILDCQDGLIILAGVTGSGKSTTIAGMIDYLNSTQPLHIITVEDPIEYEFKNKRSFVSQREIGVDCENFKAAIRTIVRQDPDVILVGEMRDPETFEFGITAAETGHLVFGTLHAGTVPQSIGRILGLFPTEKHPMLRQGLQFNLRSIICQKLLPSPKYGRIPINEILIATPIVKKILADGDDKRLMGVMAGAKDDGMMTFDACIVDRAKAGDITEEVAMEFATNPEQTRLALQGVVIGGSKGGLA